MHRVDFYILPVNTGQERFACLMTHKVWRQGNNLYINTATRENAEAFDNLLWTHRDISFIPHELTGPDTSSPVIVGWQGETANQFEVLMNLAPKIPTQAERFARIIEIVAGDQKQRELARNKYRQYRDQGYELHNHTIESDYDNP